MLLQKIDGGVVGSSKSNPSSTNFTGNGVKTLHLVILGQNELFGLEEIVEERMLRMRTVECVSTRGKCYFLPHEHFADVVNRFKFHQQVCDEHILRYEIYNARLMQTHEF